METVRNKISLNFSNDIHIKGVYVGYLEYIHQRFRSRCIVSLRPMNIECLQIQNKIWFNRHLFVIKYGELIMRLQSFKDWEPIEVSSLRDLAERLNSLNSFEEGIYDDYMKLLVLSNSQNVEIQQDADNEKDSEIQQANAA